MALLTAHKAASMKMLQHDTERTRLLFIFPKNAENFHLVSIYG